MSGKFTGHCSYLSGRSHWIKLKRAGSRDSGVRGNGGVRKKGEGRMTRVKSGGHDCRNV